MKFINPIQAFLYHNIGIRNLIFISIICLVGIFIFSIIPVSHSLAKDIRISVPKNLFSIQSVWVQSVWAEQSSLSLSSSDSSASLPNNIKLNVTSQQHIHGQAGQFINIEGTVTNVSPTEIVKGGLAYISLVDLKDKVPVDLEDWSAEKGLYIPSILPGQSLPLEWKVRLVKAGSYTIDLIFNKDNDLSSPPSASSRVFLEVAPKLNLNPGNVLPVAFGVPAILMASFGFVNYIRGRKMGVFK